MKAVYLAFNREVINENQKNVFQSLIEDMIVDCYDTWKNEIFLYNNSVFTETVHYSKGLLFIFPSRLTTKHLHHCFFYDFCSYYSHKPLSQSLLKEMSSLQLLIKICNQKCTQ